MPATFTIPLITVIPGQTITAALWDNEFNNIDTNFVPAGMDDYSATDPEMQTATDPYPAGATSRPTSLQGEIERLRYQLANILGETYWYYDPDVDISTFKTRFDAHTHDGTSNNGPQLAAAGLASNAVTTAKILDSNVTTAKIADANVTTVKILDANVTTAKIANAAVDENKLAASVAGNGLAGAAGTALSVNVDGSTIEISSDSLRVKDAGITVAKLAADVLARMSPKTIQRLSIAVSVNVGSDNSATVQGSTNQAITSVDTTKSVVCMGGARITSQSNQPITGISWSARLTSATNVAAVVSISPGDAPGNETLTVTVDCEVLEFN